MCLVPSARSDLPTCLRLFLRLPPPSGLLVRAFRPKSQSTWWEANALVLSLCHPGESGCQRQESNLGSWEDRASLPEHMFHESPRARMDMAPYVRKHGRALPTSSDSRRAKRRLPAASWPTKATGRSPGHSACRVAPCIPTWNACTRSWVYTAASNWRRRSSPPTLPGASSRLPRQTVRCAADLHELVLCHS